MKAITNWFVCFVAAVVLFVLTSVLSSCVHSSDSKYQNDQQNSKKLPTDKTKSKEEAFSDFYQRFYTDSLFQYSRIKFPLPGINTDDQDIGGNKPYNWQKDRWQLNYMPDKKAFNCKTTKSGNLIIEKITSHDDPGLIVESRFKEINGKWFLIYFANVNL